ncbi:MAG: hypothetical protein AAFV53_29350 [Myxococcota bacterium]
MVLIGWLLGTALAATPTEQAQLAEMDRVRADVADQVHLAAYDLIDELLYGWVQKPPFAAPTPVVLAGVTVPVGLGTGMEALLENHIAAVLTKNPTTNVQLVHCPSCTAVVVHSGPEGTVVSRGVDSPEVLAKLGEDTGKHALFVDVEAEGAFLVLRARMTRLEPDLPIVYSHTVATSASTPAMLREPDRLKSATEAREEYIAALHDRGPVTIPLRLAIRQYARPNGNQATGAPPFLWLQTGVELGSSDALVWTSSIIVGYSFIPQAYQGLMGQARIGRLVTGRTRSLTRPDLYVFIGTAAISIWGPATASFRERRLTADEIITDQDQDDPRNTFGALHAGVDLRINNRIGMAVFLETLPALRDSPNLGEFITIGNFDFQTFGAEVTFCF